MAAFELKSFYKKDSNGKKVIDPDLFDKKAESIAASFYGKKKDSNGKEIKDSNGKEIIEGISITQLRRLFDEVKRFQQILENANGAEEAACWDAQLPYIKMIKSKVRYTIARMKKSKPNLRRYYENLSSFISQAIDLIKDKEDYLVFSSLFEAVYGFYYEYAPKESGN